MQAQISCGCFSLNTQPHITLKPQPFATTTFDFLCKTSPTHLRLQILACNRNGTRLTTLHLLKCFSDSSETTTEATATTTRDSEIPISSTDYLVSSLGISPESALKITNHIVLRSVSNAESVLDLFREYGFESTQMVTIFSKLPVLLSYDPHKNLKPKLDFFTRNGISVEALSDIVTNGPIILARSLEKKIVPAVNFLKTFFGDDNHQDLVSFLSSKRATRFLHSFSDTTAANVETLRRHGVPYSNIVKMLHLDYGVVSGGILYRDADEFDQNLMEIKEMGFDPSSMKFVYGIRALMGIKKDRWVSKMEVFKSFGWTDEQVLALFVKLPRVMWSSEEKLKEALDCFMNKFEWTVDDITRYPALLSFSIHKRILPRFAVIEILMSRGLEKDICMGYAFQMSEESFLERFVMSYQLEIPQLLDTL